MKRILCATTALTTLGLLATAVDASAAEPSEQKLKLELGGYHQQWAVAAKQDVNTGNGVDIDTAPVDEKHNSEICFIGDVTLESGISVGVQVELEANTSADQIDESYLYLESDTYGLFQMGDTDNAAYKMAVVAPNGGVLVNDGDLVGIEAFALPDGFLPSNSTIDMTGLKLTDDDSSKFNFFTPRYAGFQVGLSYIPRFEGGTDSNNSIVRVQDNEDDPRNRVKDGFSAGLNFTEEFGGVGVQASAGFLYGDTPPEAGSSNVWGASAGIQLAFGGFTFGGSYAKANGDIPGGLSLDGDAFDIGAAYTVGPYTVGITYIRGTSEGSRADSSDQHLDQGVISGTYKLGPGVDLVGGLFAYDADGENQLVDGTDGISGNHGFGFATGLKLSF
jgi:predicted porin